MARARGGAGGGGGVLLTNSSGVTTNAFVPLFTILGLDGLLGIGTIKNLSATAAAGTIHVPAAPATINNGETFILNDGVHAASVFEFRRSGSVTPGNILVNIATVVSILQLLTAMNSAINGVGAGLAITSTIDSPNPQLTLLNDATGSAGNQAITDTVANGDFTHTGMSGGTGAFDMLVRETVIDAFGVTDFVDTIVPAGDSYLLDLQTNFGAACAPYVSYTVEVMDNVANDHVSFNLYLTTEESGGSSGTVSFPPSTYIFTSPDTLTTTDNALIPWIPGTGRTISQLLAVVKAASVGADIILEYFVGDLLTGTVGASLGTLTIPAGDFTATASITPVIIGYGQFLAMTINQVGSGTAGSNLTAIAR
jgi:hypothetical protein